MSTSHLFLFSLGPVQTFISQSRKTRDLYAASKLISDLTQIGINTFIRQRGQVLLPLVTSADHRPAALPNRFLGETTETDQSKLATIGQAVEEAVRAYFHREALRILGPETIIWDDQVKSHLSIHWLFVPVADATSTAFWESHLEINRLLGAIKNERRFDQLIEQGRKCLLEGDRNALFYRPSPTGDKPAGLSVNAAKRQVKGAAYQNLYPSEALSAVGLMKRMYSEADFPSTVEIATMETRQQLSQTNEWKSYRDLLIKELEAPWDWQFLYAENLNEVYLERQDYKDLIDFLPDIRDEHRKLLRKCQELQVRLGKYYALLVFDGDRAGQWVSGEFLTDYRDLRAFHSFISEKLSTYARQARLILKEPYGKTVYAGGDDFIGFINLDHLLPVLRQLRQQFDVLVNQPIQKEFSIKQQVDFTFSAGVAVAHYKEPLRDVIRLAREAEKASKAVPGKNACTIAIVRHSDHLDSSFVTLPWSLADGRTAGMTMLQTIVTRLQARYVNGRRKPPLFSNTFISRLQQTLRDAGEEPDPTVIYPLIRYYVGRAYMGPSERKQEDVDHLMVALDQLWQASANPDRFASALDSLDFISNHLNPLRTDA